MFPGNEFPINDSAEFIKEVNRVSNSGMLDDLKEFRQGGGDGTSGSYFPYRDHPGEGADTEGDDRRVRGARLLRGPRRDQALLQSGAGKGARRHTRSYRGG